MDRRSIKIAVIEEIFSSFFSKWAEGINTPIDEIVLAIEKFRRDKLRKGEEISSDDKITLDENGFICINDERIIQVQFNWRKPKFDYGAYKAEGRILAKQEQNGLYDNGNTLIVNVKSSKNKAIFKIDIKKFEMDIKEFKNNFEVILNEVEYFLKLPSYDWLKFEYKGL